MRICASCSGVSSPSFFSVMSRVRERIAKRAAAYGRKALLFPNASPPEAPIAIPRKSGIKAMQMRPIWTDQKGSQARSWDDLPSTSVRTNTLRNSPTIQATPANTATHQTRNAKQSKHAPTATETSAATMTRLRIHGESTKSGTPQGHQTIEPATRGSPMARREKSITFQRGSFAAVGACACCCIFCAGC